MNLRTKYEYTRRFGRPLHIFTVIGERGGIHLHISIYDDEREPSAGIEVHYRTAPDHMRGDAPSSDECWLLHCPCWHDGSSLYASEYWVPRWKRDPHDIEGMLQALECEYMQRFHAPQDSE